MLCGQLQVVMWNQCKHVVHLVGADAVNHIVHYAIVSVNSGQLTSDVVPLRVCEPRQVHLVMMKECDDDAVAGKDEVRYDVVNDNGCQTEHRIELIEQIGHDGQGSK